MIGNGLISKIFSNSKLQQKFFTYFAGIVILMIILLSVAVFFFQRHMLSTQAVEKATSLTSMLAYVSNNAVFLDDYSVLQTLIDATIVNPDVLSIVILDTTGQVIAADQPKLRGNFLTDPLTMTALSSESLHLEPYKTDQGEDAWYTSVPIFHFDIRIGTALLKYSIEDTYAGLLRTILGIGLATLVLSLILSYRISRSISKPINDAAQLAGEYGRGNFDAKIPEHSDDEIGQMVESLNKLSTELSRLLNEKIAHEGLLMIGEFASYIIHDLKNPVNGIHLLADGLHRKLSEDSNLKKYSTEILLASQRVEDFIRRTLDIAKTTEMIYQNIQINDLIDETIKEVPIITTDIIRRYDTKMPSIKGDYGLLSMAVKNLLTNASEATVDKGEITIRTEWNGKAIIEISDSGIGIPSDRLETIFRPFFSMKNTGHGLGLAMVKRAVTMHQGIIEVSSEEGVGSKFTISLPRNNSAISTQEK